MRTGITVKATAKILNISTNYVYRLVREGELELISKEPTLISVSSIKLRLMKLIPFLATDLAITTDYQLNQYAIAA
jgi:hypothetical protein